MHLKCEISPLPSPQLHSLSFAMLGTCQLKKRWSYVFTEYFDCDNYSQITIDFRGERYHFNRHQLSLWLKLYEDESFDLANWDDTKLTSHLCSKKRCVNPAHLTLESMDKNIERVRCFEDRHGHGHGVTSPACIL